MHSKLIIPILIGAVVLWRIFIRTRRSFGRQRVQPKRMAVRIGILGLFAIALLAMTVAAPWSLAGVIAGIGCGALLSLLALRHTQIEATPEGRFYTPHTYIGLTVTVLFLARLVYDFMLFRNAASLPITGGRPPTFHESPLTLAVSGAFIGYYIAYYVGVLRRSRVPLNATASMPSEPRQTQS
jgi:cytochrome b561